MRLLLVLLSVAGVSGLVWVCPVAAEVQGSRGSRGSSPKAIVLNVKFNLSFSGDRYELNPGRMIGHHIND